MKRALFALLAFFVVGSALGQSPAKIRVTTWNLEWFPKGSPRETTPEIQAQRTGVSEMGNGPYMVLLVVKRLASIDPHRRAHQDFI
jgi:hypothetical protein